ncbi:hypothetical protein FKP32DRAFT_1600302 [Trametes sanguinea]|nr:hypothetical protein FKP32DRAFT_1600302 [Trametes sanguinea]
MRYQEAHSLLELDETDTLNKSYVCFLRRETKVSGRLERPKHRTPTEYTGCRPNSGRRLISCARSREPPRSHLLLGTIEDEELCLNKEKPPKKPWVESRIRHTRVSDNLASPIAHPESDIRPKEREAAIRNQTEQELQQRKETDKQWRGASDPLQIVCIIHAKSCSTQEVWTWRTNCGRPPQQRQASSCCRRTPYQWQAHDALVCRRTAVVTHPRRERKQRADGRGSSPRAPSTNGVHTSLKGSINELWGGRRGWSESSWPSRRREGELRPCTLAGAPAFFALRGPLNHWPLRPGLHHPGCRRSVDAPTHCPVALSCSRLAPAPSWSSRFLLLHSALVPKQCLLTGAPVRLRPARDAGASGRKRSGTLPSTAPVLSGACAVPELQRAPCALAFTPVPFYDLIQCVLASSSPRRQSLPVLLHSYYRSDVHVLSRYTFHTSGHVMSSVSEQMAATGVRARLGTRLPIAVQGFSKLFKQTLFSGTTHVKNQSIYTTNQDAKVWNNSIGGALALTHISVMASQLRRRRCGDWDPQRQEPHLLVVPELLTSRDDSIKIHAHIVPTCDQDGRMERKFVSRPMFEGAGNPAVKTSPKRLASRLRLGKRATSVFHGLGLLSHNLRCHSPMNTVTGMLNEHVFHLRPLSSPLMSTRPAFQPDIPKGLPETGVIRLRARKKCERSPVKRAIEPSQACIVKEIPGYFRHLAGGVVGHAHQWVIAAAASITSWQPPQKKQARIEDNGAGGGVVARVVILEGEGSARSECDRRCGKSGVECDNRPVRTASFSVFRDSIQPGRSCKKTADGRSAWRGNLSKDATSGIRAISTGCGSVGKRAPVPCSSSARTRDSMREPISSRCHSRNRRSFLRSKNVMIVGEIFLHSVYALAEAQ